MENIKLNSWVKSITRGDDVTIRYLVKGSEEEKVLKSKYVILAFPQHAKNMQMVKDLDEFEKGVFKKIIRPGYYVGIVDSPILKERQGPFFIMNYDPNRLYGLPKPPTTTGVGRTTENGPLRVLYTSDRPMDHQTVKENMVKDLAMAGIPVSKFLAWEEHVYNLKASNEDIKNGFYRDLYSLQGRNKTFYTGALFSFESNLDVWNYSDKVINDYIKKPIKWAPFKGPYLRSPGRG